MAASAGVEAPGRAEEQAGPSQPMRIRLPIRLPKEYPLGYELGVARAQHLRGDVLGLRVEPELTNPLCNRDRCGAQPRLLRQTGPD